MPFLVPNPHRPEWTSQEKVAPPGVVAPFGQNKGKTRFWARFAAIGKWKKEAQFTKTKDATPGTTRSLVPSSERPPP
jgi:hypothetical protein